MTNVKIATRLSCFALISAIESDLRALIKDSDRPKDTDSILPTDVREKTVKRWREHLKIGPNEVPADETELLNYSDFSDLSKVLHRMSPDFALTNPKVGEIATRLDELTGVRNRVCHSRPLEADDFSELYDFAVDVVKNYRSLGWKELAGTLKTLRDDPGAVLKLVIPGFWAADVKRTPHNMPLPEFDDTGFLGRVTDRREVLKLLKGPHPVVTIVGEGGVGKTALAQRCLHDLIEDHTGPHYDAIIWFSLKTRALTGAGVKDIRAAIGSTTKLITAFASTLGPANDSQPNERLIEEIKEYLAAFRIILVIDNLETVAWQELRPLLAEVPTGSKICITSRIGLQELEIRYSLDSLDTATAVALMRRFGKMLNVKSLSAGKEDTLRTYVTLLFHSPLLIKWFVAGVNGGTNAKQILRRDETSFIEAIRF